MKLRVVLGTMTFGSQTNQPDATAQLAHFVGLGHSEVDTARMYNKGGTETMLGAIFGERADLRDAVRVASKANAFDGYDKVGTEAFCDDGVLVSSTPRSSVSGGTCSRRCTV